MTDADLDIKAMDILFDMYTAIKNVQLYEAESPIITNSVERFYMHLQDILKQETPLIFSESEKQAMMRGMLLNEKEQNAAHILFLMDILRDFGLQTFSFDKGLQREELHNFVILLAKNPKAIHFGGGLPKLMRDNKITHIHAVKKTYALNDQGQGTTSADINKSKASESATPSADDPMARIVSEMMKASSLLEEMDGKIESITSRDQKALLHQLSVPLIEWLTHTEDSADYKKTCQEIERLLHELIRRKLFDEAIPIINIFSNIISGVLKKNDKVRGISLDVFRNLASETNINVLLKEHRTNENNKNIKAGQILAEFGDIIVNKLLDTIRDSSDSKERVRTIHLVEEIGDKAIPVIKGRIDNNVPWYFLRNLAYILGRIGNEDSIDMLQPLVLHNDKRVRMEAFKSIIQKGGNKKGPLLLSILPRADYEFRMKIIEMLGKIRSVEAVPELMMMLKDKSSMSKENQISLQENICNALGAIGSTKAIPLLSEITDSKSFLGISSYPIEVKYAAKRALASIQRKQEENKH